MKLEPATFAVINNVVLMLWYYAKVFTTQKIHKMGVYFTSQHKILLDQRNYCPEFFQVSFGFKYMPYQNFFKL